MCWHVPEIVKLFKIFLAYYSSSYPSLLHKYCRLLISISYFNFLKTFFGAFLSFYYSDNKQRGKREMGR